MTVIIKRSRPGTAIRLASTCHRVLMRNMNPGPSMGKWQPITTHGFLVVCQSYLEAVELVLMVGGPLFPRPNPKMDDDVYERWLLKNHFHVEQWSITPKHYEERETLEVIEGKNRVVMGVSVKDMETTFALFVRGWYPAAEDIPGVVHNNSGVMTMIEGLMRSRMVDR